MVDESVPQKFKVATCCKMILEVRACHPQRLSFSDRETEGKVKANVTVGEGTYSFVVLHIPPQKGCHALQGKKSAQRGNHHKSPTLETGDMTAKNPAFILA
jgi:hypothetical protein